MRRSQFRPQDRRRPKLPLRPTRVQEAYSEQHDERHAEIDGVYTAYDKADVLQGVSLKVEASTITCLLGSNGSGKTTLVRSILGLTPPRAGRIVFDGTDITHLPTHRIIAAGIACILEGRRFFLLQWRKTFGSAATRNARTRSPRRAWPRSCRFSSPRRAAQAACRNDVRRRASDGLDRPRPDVCTKAAVDR